LVQFRVPNDFAIEKFNLSLSEIAPDDEPHRADLLLLSEVLEARNVSAQQHYVIWSKSSYSKYFEQKLWRVLVYL